VELAELLEVELWGSTLPMVELKAILTIFEGMSADCAESPQQRTAAKLKSKVNDRTTSLFLLFITLSSFCNLVRYSRITLAPEESIQAAPHISPSF
jgi:hypothetical protein